MKYKYLIISRIFTFFSLWLISLGLTFFVFSLSAVNAATLSLSPSELSVSAGDAFDVNILLDTIGAATDGVDIHYLNFDPELLEVRQIRPGALYPTTQSNTFDNKTGKINFSQITAGGISYTGSGTLATITFEALNKGTASVNFDFTPGNTRDTNVASVGIDALTEAGRGTYTIGGSQGFFAWIANFFKKIFWFLF